MTGRPKKYITKVNHKLIHPMPFQENHKTQPAVLTSGEYVQSLFDEPTLTT